MSESNGKPLFTLLAYWINERYRIFTLKEKGVPSPWSSDPIFRTTRFTNVHRENDKVTRWIKQYWRDPYADHAHLTLGMVLARMVNRPSTLEIIRFPTQWGEQQREHYKKILRVLAKEGPVWGNAYVITTCGKKMAKEDYVIDWVCNQVAWRVLSWDSLASSHEQLMRVDGLGSFLAAQIIADLKNTPGHPLQTAPDRTAWCAHGPGSLRGLTALYGRPVTSRGFERYIRHAYEQVMPLVLSEIPPIDMQDFQNCLCEFSKYTRIQNGGRAKNSYPGQVDSW